MDGEGFPRCGFHLRTIWVVLSNQNVLSVIKTICLLCAFLLEKLVVFDTLGVAQGHSNLMSPFHPPSRKPHGGIEMPSAVVCLHFQEGTEMEVVGWRTRETSSIRQLKSLWDLMK